MNNTLSTEIKNTGKIAAFDFDHTLVRPLNGKFPKDVNDWTFLYENIPNIIKFLHDSGFDIVIFSNQSKEWKLTQIKKVISELKIPISAFIAIEKFYYKPNKILFDSFINDSGIKNINYEESFFVGDALDSKIHFSDSDAVFAKNIGFKVYSPEIFIQTYKFLESKNNSNIDIDINIKFKLEEIPIVDHHEIIIMVGYPGSGKTTLAKAIMNREPHKYIILSKDNKLTDKKIINAIMTTPNMSFIIDNTNPSEKRNEYIVNNLPHRIIHVNTSREESKLRNSLREKPVPNIAYVMYDKKFVNPFP